VGAVTDTVAYDAYGNTIVQTGSTINAFLYASQWLDAATGQYFNRARYLNTAEGRFTSRDHFDGKTLDPLSLNHYVYASADPPTASIHQALKTR